MWAGTWAEAGRDEGRRRRGAEAVRDLGRSRTWLSPAGAAALRRSQAESFKFVGESSSPGGPSGRAGSARASLSFLRPAHWLGSPSSLADWCNWP
jgi:hypothetical protein